MTKHVVKNKDKIGTASRSEQGAVNSNLAAHNRAHYHSLD
jgi:hypothetical protein